MRQLLVDLIEENQNLPSFPDVVSRLEEELRKPTVSDRSVADLIKSDASLVGRILQVANSAFYSSGRREVSTLTMAITRLGHKTIKELVYSLEFTKLFSKFTVIDHKRFWRHSIAVGVFAQSLCRRLGFGISEIENAYLAGLMHDVGVLVFLQLAPKEYGFFLGKVGSQRVSLPMREREYFDIDHAELGFRFMKKWWPVDDSVSQAVRDHHLPIDPRRTEREISDLVNVANSICNYLDFDNGLDIYSNTFTESVWLSIGVPLEQVEQLLEEVQESIRYAEELVSVS